jgi:predicted metal-binding protein
LAEPAKYISLALDLGMSDAMLISPNEIAFDIRANLKCAWGCDRQFTPTIKCDPRGTTCEERIQMIEQYHRIVLLHCHDPKQLSETILELEKTAFLDGYYFAFAIRSCNLCQECSVIKGGICPHPDKVRPCDSLFGIDVYKTVRRLGLPCEVLRSKEEQQNRYGFLLID